jgi:hypothetical protein
MSRCHTNRWCLTNIVFTTRRCYAKRYCDTHAYIDFEVPSWLPWSRTCRCMESMCRVHSCIYIYIYILTLKYLLDCHGLEFVVVRRRCAVCVDVIHLLGLDLHAQMYVCMCVCIYIYTYIHTHTHIYIYAIYIYVCMYVRCMYVCVFACLHASMTRGYVCMCIYVYTCICCMSFELAMCIHVYVASTHLSSQYTFT